MWKRKAGENNKRVAGKDTQSGARMLAYPQLPTLFPLSKPKPNIIEKIESTLISLVEETNRVLSQHLDDFLFLHSYSMHAKH